ncbi:MAG: PEGA domain-containing protein [Spirochaetales bacterium]|nr:PEGA domain-containing protein [Spirochaetales bacterium]
MGVVSKTSIKVIFFLFLSFSVYSFEFKDPSENWKIAILEAELVNVPQNLQHLAFLFPELVAEFLDEIDNHVLTDSEIIARQRFLYSQEFDKISKNISSKRKSLDEAFFKRERDEAAERKLASEIYSYNSQLRALEKLDFRTISVFEALPIKLVYAEEKDRKLFSYNSNIETKVQFATRTESDYIIFPKIEYLSSVLYVSLDVYSKIEGKLIFSKTTVGDIGNFSDIPQAFYKELVTLVAGRLWASVKITTTPITSSIYLNGEKRGAGVLRIPFLTPGKYVVTIENAGYFTDEMEISLEPYEYKEIDFVLKKVFSPPVLINTFPANADVFLSSKWVGKTPFVILSPGENEHFMIRKPGYLDYSGFIDSQLLAQQNFIFLNFLESSSTERLKKKREQFYTSLALLSLTLPVTLISSGFSSNFPKLGSSSMYPDINYHDQYAAYYATQAIFISGIILNVIMGINMIVESVDYVRYADIM